MQGLGRVAVQSAPQKSLFRVLMAKKSDEEYEPRDQVVSVALPKTLKQMIETFAKDEEVTPSTAICYMVGVFFSPNLRKTKVSAKRTKVRTRRAGR